MSHPLERKIPRAFVRVVWVVSVSVVWQGQVAVTTIFVLKVIGHGIFAIRKSPTKGRGF